MQTNCNPVRNVLIVVSNESHFNGSLSIAEAIMRIGHKVQYYYAGFDEYNTDFSSSPYPVKKLPFVSSLSPKSAGSLINELLVELDLIEPKLVILDSDLQVYYCIFHSLKIPSVLLNFFVPFRKTQNVPPFTSSWIPRAGFCSRVFVELLWLRYFLSFTYLRRVILFRARLKHVIKQFKIVNQLPVDYKRIFPGFVGVVEIHSSSSEFNFNAYLGKQDFFLGHVVSCNRIDNSTDESFNLRWQEMLRRKRDYSTSKIILCAFGGYSHFHSRVCFRFFKVLIEVLRQSPDWNLVLAIGKNVEAKCFPLPPNVIVSQAVPQLRILEQADAMITHGGMGSINESIHHQVPMLVYPLNPRGDQPGNAARVQFLGMGIAGNMTSENESSVRSKLQALMYTPEYRNAIITFKENLYSTMPFERTIRYLQGIVAN